jgi:CheY-like chemotaxis protein
MDVIVVEDSVSEALLLEKQISAMGHTVRGARTGAKAIELLKERLPNLLVTDGMLPELSGESLTRLVRSQEATRYVYVIYVTSSSDPDALRAAFAAGADDYMHKPLGNSELVARLRTADRITTLETRLRTKVRELETALRRLQAAATIVGGAAAARAAQHPTPEPVENALVPAALAEKQAWRRIDPTVQRMLGDFLQRDLSVAASDEGFQPTLARAIALTSITLGIELRFVLTLERESALSIAAGLFGPDPDEELVEDTLAELANLAMGGVKASFAEEGVTLTSGLPAVTQPEARTEGALHRQQQLFAASDGVRIGMMVEVSRCPTKRVRAFELSEGMIFSEPLTGPNGILLVPSGVRLVAATIDRITKSTTAGHVFEVLVPR